MRLHSSSTVRMILGAALLVAPWSAVDGLPTPGVRAARASPGAVVGAVGQENVSGAASDTLRALRLPSREKGAGGDAELAVRLDGRLSEPFWQDAGVLTGLRQREPEMGRPATERTEVRVAYDEETLYVGIRSHDRDPDRIVARTLRRDRLMRLDRGQELTFAGDDAVALLLDTFHDHRNATVFATNPHGAKFEALITDEGRNVNTDWRGVWEVAAGRTPAGWSAEFAIPFRTLRYPDDPPGERIWGFNVYRVIQRNQEEVLWRAWSREGGGFGRVSQAGHLAGLRELPRLGVGLEAKPYVLGRVEQNPAPEEEGLSAAGTADLGLDVKAEPHPGLVVDLTYNTDFAQVEVDEFQVNLSRFPPFFPEKRDFFLENAGVFDFGQPGDPLEPPPFLLFFSRRIGLAGGEPVPVLGGARATGRLGGQTLGFLNVATDEARGQPRTNFAVARYKRDLGENGFVGGLVTDRRSLGGGTAPEPGGLPDASNTAGGVDGSVWFGERVNLEGFLAGSVTSGAGGEGHAFRGAVTYEGDRYGAELQHLTVSPEMTAGTGFITRKGYRRLDGYVRFSPRPDVLGLRRIDVITSGEYVGDMSGRPLDRRAGNFVSFTWDSGDNLTTFYQLSRITVREEFRLADSLQVPAGSYANSWTGWFFRSDPSRTVVVGSNARFQQKFGGREVTVGGEVTVQPVSQLGITAGYRRNDVDLPTGDFVAHVGRLRTDVSLSTRLSADLFVQYNSLADDVLTNLRFNFIHRPGSDLFLVFTEDRGRPGDPGAVRNRGFVAKLTYLYRF